MRYHDNARPQEWTNYYGSVYRCNHPVYRVCTLYMKENRVDFGVTNYVENNDALNNFIDGFERSVLLRFNCDGVIIDKI